MSGAVAGHDQGQIQLLVSVRSASEAEAALAGGAHLIDVKEPGRGPLGRADEAVLADVLETVAGRRPVSAALGELNQESSPLPGVGLAYVKWGLAGWYSRSDWRSVLTAQIEVAARAGGSTQVVTTAYADGERFGSPPVAEVCAFARRRPGSVFLLDTYAKEADPSGGRRRLTLLDWLDVRQLGALCDLCRACGVRVALAGSLGTEQIRELRQVRPDWFAVRGAVCDGGRGGSVSARKVRELVELLAEPLPVSRLGS